MGIIEEPRRGQGKILHKAMGVYILLLAKEHLASLKVNGVIDLEEIKTMKWPLAISLFLVLSIGSAYLLFALSFHKELSFPVLVLLGTIVPVIGLLCLWSADKN